MTEKQAAARCWLRERGLLWSDQPVKRRDPGAEARAQGMLRALELYAESVSRPRQPGVVWSVTSED